MLPDKYKACTMELTLPGLGVVKVTHSDIKTFAKLKRLDILLPNFVTFPKI